jgi:hypothetical protein
MYFMSWLKNSYLHEMVCNDEKTVLFMADILEEKKLHFKVSSGFGMITAQEFQGDCKVYKFWIDGK